MQTLVLFADKTNAMFWFWFQLNLVSFQDVIDVFKLTKKGSFTRFDGCGQVIDRHIIIRIAQVDQALNDASA